MTTRYEVAREVVDAAARLVEEAEAELARTVDPTSRDVAESRLREAYEAQDQALAAVGPTIEERRRSTAEEAWTALRSARGDPASPWDAKFRRWHSPAVKSWLVGRLGRVGYERAFPL
jgi:hypothetical protein